MQVQESIVKAIQAAQFIAMSCNEITIVDNGSWICTHAYVVELWVKVPILLQIECIVDGSGNNNLIEVIIATLMKYGGFNKGRHVKKKIMLWCKWGICCRNPNLAKCGAEAQHLEKLRFGVHRDSRMFRARQQGAKHLALGCSWCRWKGLET
jgi:hypothetical protein